MTPQALRAAWRALDEVALFDLRDEGPFAQAHPFFAVSLPLAQIESRIEALVPRKSTPVVVYDDGEGLVKLGVERIAALGYSDVRVLEGGLKGYARHGELFRDVNVPSKAFGELVEAILHTPSLPAAEAKAILEGDRDVVVLDARRFEEFSTMSIPGGVSTPGAELALRVHDLAPSPDTLVIVNCAGRTRSLIGAQSLINAGVRNKVVALRNGTIGWTLAGFELEKGRTERFGPVSAPALVRALKGATRFADRVGVPLIDAATLAEWREAADRRTFYLLDVRTPEEYVAGHAPGFVCAPGGQLVQATDEWVAVRGARLALFDDDGVRARMTAAWLRQMGWDASVVEDLTLDERGAAPSWRTPPRDPGGASFPPAEVARLPANYVDLSPSPLYRKGHAPGAWFVAGARLAEGLANVPGTGPIFMFSADGTLAADNLADAQATTRRPVGIVEGGLDAWRAAGLPIETEAHHWATPPEDVYKRPYEGADNAAAAMQAYIDWELQLVAQMANDGVNRFHVVR